MGRSGISTVVNQLSPMEGKSIVVGEAGAEGRAAREAREVGDLRTGRAKLDGYVLCGEVVLDE